MVNTLQYSYQIPTNAFSITVPNWANVLCLNPAAALASGTVITPPAPTDGQPLIITSTFPVYALTLTASTGQTVISGSTFLLSNQQVHWVFNAAINTWLPVAVTNPIASYTLYLASNWYGAIHNGTAGAGVVGAADTMYAHPFIVDSLTGSVTFKSIGLSVQTGGTLSTVKFGVYDATGTGGRPNNLLGKATNSGSGIASTAIASTSGAFDTTTLTLSNGTYWVCSVHHGTTLPICETINSVSSINKIAGSLTLPGAVGIAANYGGFVTSGAITYASGPPATFGASTEVAGVTGNPPLVALQAN